MNKIFTNSKKIVLDDNYYLTTDGYNGVTLVFHEMRDKEIYEKIDNKFVKTGRFEKADFEDVWYFTRVAQALRKYFDLVQNNLESLKDLLEKVSTVDARIEKLDKEFKQYK